MVLVFEEEHKEEVVTEEEYRKMGIQSVIVSVAVMAICFGIIAAVITFA